jgi:HAD superfamily hydrolase (TIGR01549 family)
MNQSLEAIVFDLDDTLIATRRLYTEVYLRVLEPHRGSLSVADLAALRPGPETQFIPSLIAAERAGESLEQFYFWYEALHPKAFEGLYPGVPEMLAALNAVDVRTAIFTGKSRRAWEISSRYVELPGVSAFVFGDEIDHQKPAPDGIIKALELLDCSPDRSAYVGDSPLDVAAAKAAGVLPVAALWSRQGADREAFATATLRDRGMVFQCPLELARWLMERASDDDNGQ